MYIYIYIYLYTYRPYIHIYIYMVGVGDWAPGFNVLGCFGRVELYGCVGPELSCGGLSVCPFIFFCWKLYIYMQVVLYIHIDSVSVHIYAHACVRFPAFS